MRRLLLPLGLGVSLAAGLMLRNDVVVWYLWFLT